MARDLAKDDPQVHASDVHGMATDVLEFWFALTTKQQFAKDDALDATIAARFGAMRDGVLRGRAEGWRDDPDTVLAAIILLDQFSRNIHRDTAQAYAGDALAVELTQVAMSRGWEAQYPVARRSFLYMPLMHAEDLALQDMSVAKFTALDDDHSLPFARDHRDVIARYGRFPSRNAALGRTSTEAEQPYLARGDAGW